MNNVDWFADRAASGKPITANGIIVLALDNVLARLGAQPWNQARGVIAYRHAMLGKVHETPYANRSTFAHCVEFGPDGPTRIESMFPLGESGTILMDQVGQPVFDPDFFSMTPVYDAFAPRPGPCCGAGVPPALQAGPRPGKTVRARCPHHKGLAPPVVRLARTRGSAALLATARAVRYNLRAVREGAWST